MTRDEPLDPPDEKPPLWHKLVAPAVGLALVAPMAYLLYARLAGGSRLEDTHRAFLDRYVSDLRQGRPVEPGPQLARSLALLAGSTSWQVRDVQIGVGTDDKGDTCWTIATMSPTGEQAEIVIGISDADGPIRISGWGLRPACRCLTGSHNTGGRLRC